MSELDNQIKEVEDKIRELRGQQTYLNEELKQLNYKKIYRDHKVTIGTEVVYEGAVYKVSFLDNSFSGKPSAKGRKQKKDGTWGTVDFHLYSEWELKDES